jgi:hypothetical protein
MANSEITIEELMLMHAHAGMKVRVEVLPGAA